MLMIFLKTSIDYAAYSSIIGILHECVSPRLLKSKAEDGKRNTLKALSRATISRLINSRGTEVLIKSLVDFNPSEKLSKTLLKDVLCILGQIAKNDQKFVIEVTSLNAVTMFHALLRIHYKNPRMMLPFVFIFRSFSKNSNYMH
ncbi:uncharacterized protein [Fopius arisanus]|uniref:Uncharacterized protein n=1 Tax=Fopius arisanus TaxID=64838 RepID=A0A9R1U8X3_9HYME|nr:PREDICTED: uncharacterized protein LOC105272819 [Fopius arisanus]